MQWRASYLEWVLYVVACELRRLKTVCSGVRATWNGYWMQWPANYLE
jgi:hypothetical protein